MSTQLPPRAATPFRGAVRVALAFVVAGVAACRPEPTPDPECGNGVLEGDERCDDGNRVGGDGCTYDCFNEIPPICGDSIMSGGEECDDGGKMDGDGCSSTCTIETEYCSNGVLDPGEECDDGNLGYGDGCAGTCLIERCGDGLPQPGEECEDGNNTSGDGCSATCMFDAAPGCGNGEVAATEECDDGDNDSGDGCSLACHLETLCGDGAIEGHEQCEDGNAASGDGCSQSCLIAGPDGACGPQFNLPCGIPVMDDVTLTGVATNDYASCLMSLGFADAGPEIAYMYVAPATGPITVDLEVFVPDMDLIVLDAGPGGACDPAACDPALGSFAIGTDPEQVVFSAIAGNTYWFIVDTWIDGGDTGGPFALTVSCPPPSCGDGNVNPGEECDDSNTTSGDGCDAVCQIEPVVCGDGTVGAGEECDDGNTTAGDGCDAACALEPLCGPEVPIVCSASISDSVLITGMALADWAGCAPFAEAGPEIAYVYNPTATGDVTATLTVLDQEMDLLVVEGDPATGVCDPAACLYVGGSFVHPMLPGVFDDVVTFTANVGTTYYIVVETYTADGFTGGDFMLDLTCTP